MVDLKHQLFLNISGEAENSRIKFSKVSWIGLVLVAIAIGVMKGSPLWLGLGIGVIFSLPTGVWALGRGAAGTRIFDDFYLSAWGLVSFSAMAIGGGAMSPLTAVLVLGPLACIMLGRLDIFVHAAMIGLLAYTLAIVAGSLGWAALAPAGWQNLAAPLGVAALVQAVIFAWAIGPQLQALRTGTGNLGPEGAFVPAGIAAKPVDQARHREEAGLNLTLPVVLVHVAAEGRISQIEGAADLRWAELVPGKIASAVLGPEEESIFVAPDGTAFHVLRAGTDAGGYWVCLVPQTQMPVKREPLERTLEEALEKVRLAEADLSERTAFFAGLGHDLKTPLNAILGFSDLMKAEIRGPLPEAYKDYPAIIHESGQDLMLLVDDILDLAKAEASGHRLDLEPVDLVASAASVVRQLGDQADRVGVKLVLKETAEVWAEADARAVRQIWQNLVSNAIKYSDEGGTVTLSAGKAAGAVAISVKDRGAGMDQDDLDRIAKPFTQGANAKGRVGTGLGLAVVHRFAEMHGGKVVIDTEKGKGTRVRVTLPALDGHRLEGLEDAAQ